MLSHRSRCERRPVSLSLFEEARAKNIELGCSTRPPTTNQPRQIARAPPGPPHMVAEAKARTLENG
eukprot:6355083-Prymnesium_polylepis.1